MPLEIACSIMDGRVLENRYLDLGNFQTYQPVILVLHWDNLVFVIVGSFTHCIRYHSMIAMLSRFKYNWRFPPLSTLFTAT